MKIFVQHNGKQVGPYSLDEVRAALRARALSADDPAWREGLDAWKPLADVLFDLHQHLAGNVTALAVEPQNAAPQKATSPATPRNSRRGILIAAGAVAAIALLLAGWRFVSTREHGSTSQDSLPPGFVLETPPPSPAEKAPKVPFIGTDLSGTCLKLMRDGKPEEALALLNQAERDLGGDFDYVSCKAICYAMLGFEDRCLKEIDAALVLTSNDEEKSGLVGVQCEMLTDLGDFAALEIVAEKAVTVAPRDAGWWAWLASAFENQQKHEKCVRAAQKALTLNPDQIARSRASFALAKALDALAHDAPSHREAKTATENALLCELDEGPRALMQLLAGDSSAKIGDFDAAERHLKNALTASDTELQQLAYTALAEVYFDQKQEPKVVELLSAAVREFPKNSDYWRKLTIAYARLNDSEQAKKAGRRWKQLDPSAPEPP